MYYVNTPFGFLATHRDGQATVATDARAATVFASFAEADRAGKENARNMPEHLQWFAILVPALGGAA